MGRSKQVSLLLGIVLLGLIVTISVSSAYAFLAPTFLFKIPSVPSGQFANPFGVGVDSSDNIYVADTGHRIVQVFDNTGAFLFKFGPSFPGGSFSVPFDVAIDSTGRILVIDCALGRILVFDSGGNFLSFIGTRGGGPGQFSCSEGITVDGSDNIYVADSSNGRIQVFDKTGAFQFLIGRSFPGGSFGYPESVAIDSNGRIIVTDLASTTVSVFDSGGNFLSFIGTRGSGDGQFLRPAGVDVDSSDNIYVSDIRRHDVQIFDKNGVFLAKFGGPGSGDGQFFNPWDLAIDSSGHIVVVEVSNRRVQVFGGSDSTPPVITLNGDAIVTLLVGETYNDAGAVASDDVDGDLTAIIVTVNPVDTSTAGTYAVTYDVSDSAGNAAVQVTRTVEVQSPAQATENLIDDITSLGLPEEVENSLTAPLQNVGDKLTDNNPKNDSAACGKLEGFINQVNAQEGKKLTLAEADELRQAAQALKNSLGC